LLECPTAKCGSGTGLRTACGAGLRQFTCSVLPKGKFLPRWSVWSANPVVGFKCQAWQPWVVSVSLRWLSGSTDSLPIHQKAAGRPLRPNIQERDAAELCSLEPTAPLTESVAAFMAFFDVANGSPSGPVPDALRLSLCTSARLKDISLTGGVVRQRAETEASRLSCQHNQHSTETIHEFDKIGNSVNQIRWCPRRDSNARPQD
jgi:hypothetical protein